MCSLVESISEALMDVRRGGDPDACRATLRALRAEHGDETFEAAKVAAISFDVRRNG